MKLSEKQRKLLLTLVLTHGYNLISWPEYMKIWNDCVDNEKGEYEGAMIAILEPLNLVKILRPIGGERCITVVEGVDLYE